MPSPSACIIEPRLSSMLFAELFYTRQQCSLRSLAIMCQGLLDDAGGPLVNTSVQPWNQVKPNKLKLTAKELRDEVTRRHSASGNVLGIPPRPNAWTVARAQEWLNDNPITIAGEVAFLKAAIRQHVDIWGAEGVPEAGAAGARAKAVSLFDRKRIFFGYFSDGRPCHIFTIRSFFSRLRFRIFRPLFQRIS